MRKSLTLILTLLIVIVFSMGCNSNPPPQQVYVNPNTVAMQQQQPVQGDPNQFYNDPQYANQQPVQYMYNGQQILIDAALMAYLYTYHINPGYYYSTRMNYSHFHVYRNGYYSGYSRGYRPTFVSYSHYHYYSPNSRYVHTTIVTHSYGGSRSYSRPSYARSYSRPSYGGGYHSSYHSSFSHHR